MARVVCILEVWLRAQVSDPARWWGGDRPPRSRFWPQLGCAGEPEGAMACLDSCPKGHKLYLSKAKLGKCSGCRRPASHPRHRRQRHWRAGSTARMPEASVPVAT